MIRYVIIVGAGQSAAVTARTLRRRGYDGSLLIIGDETAPPYQRPPLSKEYLAGEASVGELALLGEQWCADNDVELRLGTRAAAVKGREVELDGGAVLTADALVIATGARPRTLTGVAGERVRYLRTVADADRLRADLVPGARVVVVGAGFIGSEVASTALGRGTSVTVLEGLDTPLQRILGKRIGQVCGALQRDSGVDLRTGMSVTGYAETPDGAQVTTGDGQVFACDVVVVGVGVTPNTELLAGFDVGDGVLVDEHGLTSVEGVYAAGDVARHHHPLYGRRVRVEHFDHASAHGTAVAKNLLGQATPYSAPHWFWSDQFDRNLQYAGHCETWDRLVIRGDPETYDFVAFYLREGRIEAAFGMERGGDIAVARQLIAAAAAPDPRALADEDVDLIDLL
ncbi:NAD(P)/FAD-dependent oxidoreductase [Nonomuraea sp. NPDC050536]|uniref:NAD(P)/FAD-dependent oxidoreductase n=1 Tax=Nonomuraea sp. NPDC050536 TaxID=3364366 RepID=UPI0037C8093A